MKFAAFALAASAIALTATADTTESAAPAEDAPATYTVEDAKADTASWRAVDPERLFIFNTNRGIIPMPLIKNIIMARIHIIKNFIL